MFLINAEIITLILLAVCVVPIACLIIWAIVVRLFKIKKKSLEEKVYQNNDEQKEVFLNAYGGSSNVISIEKERNKIIVSVKDIDIVDGEKLKELGANGVLIVGNTVKASFNDRSEFVYNTIV